MIKSLFVFAFIFAGSFAKADQCQWNSRFSSQTARAVLASQDVIFTYCAKCNDKEVKAYMLSRDNAGTEDGKDIHFRKQEANGDQYYWQLEINKTSKTQKSAELDLAYTYILMTNASNKSVLVNVGEIVNGCNPQGAEAFMPWEPSNVKCMSNDGSCG